MIAYFLIPALVKVNNNNLLIFQALLAVAVIAPASAVIHVHQCVADEAIILSRRSASIDAIASFIGVVMSSVKNV